MTVGVRFNEKLGVDVYCCPDCEAPALMITADEGGFNPEEKRPWYDGEVVCPSCKGGFGTSLEVVLNDTVEYLDETNPDN